MKNRTILCIIVTFVLSLALQLKAEVHPDAQERHRLNLRVSGRAVTSNPFAAVSARYDELTLLGMNARRQFYRTLPVEMKQDLWLHHIQRFIAEQPELSQGQMGVILDMRALISFGVIQKSEIGVGGRESWLDAVSTLDQRARGVFSSNVARALLFELGGPASGMLDFESNLDTCTCSSQSNWCDYVTNPDPNCITGLGLCTRADGCGTLFLYACNGLCGA